MKLAVQNWILESKDEFAQMEMLAKAGFKHIDLDLNKYAGNNKYTQESHKQTKSYYTSLKKHCEQLGICIAMTHTIYPTYMDDNNRQEVLNSIEKCFIATNTLGAKYTVVHPMMPKKWEGEENRELRVKENIQFYNEITPLAKKYDIIICIENMFGTRDKKGNYRETACSRYEEMAQIINNVNEKEYFGFCYDSGHANLNYHENLTDMISVLGKDLKVLHLHDNDGKYDFHKMPGKGKINWDEVFAKLKEVEFDGIYDFEIAPIGFKGLFKAKKLSKAYNDLENLLNKYLS